MENSLNLFGDFLQDSQQNKCCDQNYWSEVNRVWHPLKPTEVFATYWRFAVIRQNIFCERNLGQSNLRTDDPILNHYRFTNVYRASDRVSQYLIRFILYPQSVERQYEGDDVLFRLLLFKFFNKIETWELLKRELGEVTWQSYSFDLYDSVLTKAMSRGEKIFSSAYIMPSGQTSFGEGKKHRNFLHLLEHIITTKFFNLLSEVKSLQEVYSALRSFPLLGNFLAFQFAIDLNYWDMLNFDESTFVVAGPGAKDGIAKCFSNAGIYKPEHIIKLMSERQEEEFSRLSMKFNYLGHRQLQWIDCQNLFCEVDKYSRVAHPLIQGVSGRTRIKRLYRRDFNDSLPLPYYPPKWGINEAVSNMRYEKREGVKK